jgi:hypothetical protein
VTFRARHLREDRLFDCYLAEQTGDAMEPPSAEHLADCAECATRFADLRRFMDGLRSEADHELDDAFPADQLRLQQQHILRRLEHLAHPARIISFPGHPPDQSIARSHPRIAPRWLGAAAAAGLLIGVAAGSFFYPGTGRAAQRPSGGGAIKPAALSSGGGSPVIEARRPDLNELNEQFLSDLETALERPHTPELVALDDLTPHVREVRVQLR